MRFRLLCAGSMLMLLAACGSGDGSGARPTLPSDASIVRPTSPPEGAGIPPVETQPSEPEQIAPPEATAPPEEQPEATAAPGTAPVSGAAPVDDDGGAVWWPWILLAVVLVVVAAVAMARGRRRSPSWQVRSTTLLDEIEQLTSHLAVVTPAGLHAVAQSDAMKLATLRATLRELVASAPDANSGAALNQLTATLAALHGAVDAIAMSADPSMQPDATSVTQLATQLHTASTAARADLAIAY